LTLGGPHDQADAVTRRLLLVVGLALTLAPGGAAAYSSSTWYEGADGWAQAQRAQKAHGVPIFLYFTADWCAPCHALDDVLEERAVRERLRGLIKVRIAPDDGDEEEEIFIDEFGGHSFPTLFLVSPEGTRRRLSHGPAEYLLRQLP
jgi:thiol:disulfide interchange protein